MSGLIGASGQSGHFGWSRYDRVGLVGNEEEKGHSIERGLCDLVQKNREPLAEFFYQSDNLQEFG
ncbi:hypothetical protein [Streptococcus parauberis]|uniref:hypothetical protein n=1 Tax=Streptococcus parauberis TaxID=1348 RepID=UPI00374D4EB1